MNGVDAIKLQAFLLALSQLDVPLSQDLHRSIQLMGRQLANHQIDCVNQISSVVEQHDRLRELYEAAQNSLESHYRSPHQAEATIEAENLTAVIDDVAVPILIADNFSAAARQLLKRAKSRYNQLPHTARVFVLSLEKAIATTDATTLAVLEALEKRPLSVKGLVYVVGLTLDQAWTIVRDLWQQGYIDRVTDNIFYKIFPMLKNRQRSSRTLDAETYLTLTAKGHFHLHPVVSLGMNQNRLE